MAGKSEKEFNDWKYSVLASMFDQSNSVASTGNLEQYLRAFNALRSVFVKRREESG